MKCVEAHISIICPFWSYHCHSNRNILSPILLTLSDVLDVSKPIRVLLSPSGVIIAIATETVSYSTDS